MSFTLASIVRDHDSRRRDDVAIVCGEQRLTWGELHERSSRVANALIAGDLHKGDRIAVLAHNNAEFFELAFGCAKLGAVLVALNWRLARSELAAVLADAEPALLIVEEELAELIDPGAAPAVMRFGRDYERWRDAGAATDPIADVGSEDLAYMLYSSGTTGSPKGVTITHANLALSERMAREGFRMDAGSVHMCPGPQFHIAGAGTGLMTMFCGGRTVIMRDPDPGSLLATIVTERVTHAFMVPAVIQALIDLPQIAEHDVSSLQQISYGAAPMTEALLRRAMRTLGCGFLGVYGMTETAGTVATLTPEDHEPDGSRSHLLQSVGRPLPWIELIVRDRVTGREADAGTVGEICVRSGQNTSGYWRQRETTDQTISSDGWLRTGDGAYRDPEGYIYLRDRIKDMIISGGENVYPAEVENALADHPDVADVAVIGVPDPRWGETVKAVVVLRPGAELDFAALRAFARTKIAGYKCPTSVEFVDALPRNPSGKVLKVKLRESYAHPAAPAG